jgi:hypothetical protein
MAAPPQATRRALEAAVDARLAQLRTGRRHDVALASRERPLPPAPAGPALTQPRWAPPHHSEGDPP